MRRSSSLSSEHIYNSNITVRARVRVRVTIAVTIICVEVSIVAKLSPNIHHQRPHSPILSLTPFSNPLYSPNQLRLSLLLCEAVAHLLDPLLTAQLTVLVLVGFYEICLCLLPEDEPVPQY